MSKASVWAALVLSGKDAAASTEALRPPSLTVGSCSFMVNRDGGLNLSGPSSVDLTPDDIAALYKWISDTFSPPPAS